MRLLLLSIAILVLAAPAAWAQAPIDGFYDSFEFADMRNVNLNGSVCMADNEYSSNPGGRCTNSQGHSSIWTGLWQLDTGFVNDPVNCHNSSWCIQNVQHTNETFGNTYMAWTGYSTGDVAFLPTPTYFRAWFKFPVGWTLPATCSGGKLIYMRQFASPDPTSILVGHSPWTGGVVYNLEYPVISGGALVNQLALVCNVPGQSCRMPFDGQWHSLEVLYSPNTHQMTVWQDDVMQINYTGLPGDAYTARVDSFGAGLYNVPSCTGSPGGCTSSDICAPAQQQFFYVDDMAMSSQRIGGGAAPLLPGTPSNLTISMIGP